MSELMTLSNITALKFASSAATILRRMTFLYDANWVPDGSNSLPFAFFHIIKQEEINRNEVSQKRVILHQLGLTDSATGVLSVISDNIVPQPKVWRLSVLIPMDALFPAVEEAIYDLEVGTRFAATYTNAAKDILNNTASTLSVIRLLLRLFSVSNDVMTYFTQNLSMVDLHDYNKDSLEKMCVNRALLRMKEWNSWTYKYGVVTNITLSKEPLEEQYYKGTIEFQEMPIMTAQTLTVPPVPAVPGIMQTGFQFIRPVVEGVLLR